MRKPRSRKDMISYLTKHYRYDTAGSWNGARSYAQCVKLHKLDFPNKQVENTAWAMLDVPEAFWGVRIIIQDFGSRHNYRWQIGWNGRSDGYLVLYSGDSKLDDHKRQCLECGQLNYRADAAKCGRCGSEEMDDYEGLQTFMYPGKGIDMGEDFEDWDTYSIKGRVDVVWDFDRTVDKAVAAFVKFCDEHTVETRTIMVPKEVQVAVATA